MLVLRPVFRLLGAVALAAGATGTPAASPGPAGEVDASYAKAYSLYMDLHQHPELSGAETVEFLQGESGP